MGETVIHPKPRGIVLPPLIVVPPIDAQPTVPQPHVALTQPAAPEPVPKPTLVNTDGDRVATMPSAILCEALAASLAEALFLEREEVALDKPFTDLGLDSIIAVEWVRALNTRYGTTLTVTKVYDYPTILTFAAFLEHELGPQTPAPVVHSPGRDSVGVEIGSSVWPDFEPSGPSLDDVLQRVQQGHLDIAQAYQLIQQIDA